MLGAIGGDSRRPRRGRRRPIPYKPEALERLDRNKREPGQARSGSGLLPPGHSARDLHGHPFQIVQGGNDDILMVYEYASANRVIDMREVDIPPIDTWMGTSYGRWDGDTLEVITLAQSPGEYKAPGGEMISDSVTWLDRAGNYLSNTATVTERFTRWATTTSSTARRSTIRNSIPGRGLSRCRSTGGWSPTRNCLNSVASRSASSCYTATCLKRTRLPNDNR